MKKKILTGLTATLLFGSIVASPAGHKTRRPVRRTAPAAVDTLKSEVEKSETTADAISRLTDDDYREVADRLGIEIATIKAVVEIEAGAAHEGFYKAGMPIINFDMSMFRKFAGKNGINLSKYYKSHAIVFSRPNASRYGGSTQAAQHARLKAARTIHHETAIQGCFWGMFQIGGFNWRRCGCGSIDEFVENRKGQVLESGGCPDSGQQLVRYGGPSGREPLLPAGRRGYLRPGPGADGLLPRRPGAGGPGVFVPSPGQGADRFHRF